MKYYFLLVTFLIIGKAYTQSVDLETVTKTNFKVTGGINANSVFYNSNVDSGREPFTYLLSGNLNFSAFSFSMPINYSITNQGENLNYQVPFNFNKLNLAPKYKWIKAYIGDASMSFSPYTLSGHPFRGLGVELTPKGSFKISAMGGRLLKAVEVTNDPQNIPVFDRFGYGTKIGFQQDKYKLEFISFFAKDNINSIAPNYDEKGVTPKQNLVSSIVLNTTVIPKVDFNFEYAMSIFTDDIRALKSSRNGFTSKIIGARENTTYLKALKTDFNYTIGSSKIGLAYERVDPNYKTLGALYINNDLENIAITFARPFYNNKISLSTNLGYQRDDLKLQKQQNTKRVVGSVNLNYMVNEKLNLTGSYSNFTTYTNKNLNQFDIINNENISPADTLNYRQLSQNMTLNATYTFGKKKNQNLNLNYNISGQANEQGGLIRKGQASNVQNINLAHAYAFKELKMALNSSFNYTLNTVGVLENSSMGGSVSVTKKFLSDKLSSNLGVVYNSTEGSNTKSTVSGIKTNLSYSLYKKHNFTLSGIQMFRNSTNKNMIQDLTVNFNYSYAFDNFSFKRDRNKKEKEIVEERKENDSDKIIFKALNKLKLDANKTSEKLDRIYFKRKYGSYLEHVIFKNGEDDFFEAEKNQLKLETINLSKQEKGYLSHYLMLEIINPIKTKEDLIKNVHLQKFINSKSNIELTDSEEEINKLEIEIAKYFYNLFFQ